MSILLGSENKTIRLDSFERTCAIEILTAYGTEYLFKAKREQITVADGNIISRDTTGYPASAGDQVRTQDGTRPEHYPNPSVGFEPNVVCTLKSMMQDDALVTDPNTQTKVKMKAIPGLIVAAIEHYAAINRQAALQAAVDQACSQRLSDIADTQAAGDPV